MLNKQTLKGLALATVMVVFIANSASAQGGPAMPGPTGAPRVNPPIIAPPITPPIGGPVVLGPPTTIPPPVPRGAREALQGQVVREVGQRKTLNLRCPPSEPGEFTRFATISGRLQKGSTLTITGSCFGTQVVELYLCVQANASATSYFLPNPDNLSDQVGWATFGLKSLSRTPTRLAFPVTYNPDPAQHPISQPKVVRLELLGKNRVNFRASLSQPDIDTLVAGGTITNPPSNP
jgi:hypothetical protein